MPLTSLCPALSQSSSSTDSELETFSWCLKKTMPTPTWHVSAPQVFSCETLGSVHVLMSLKSLTRLFQAPCGMRPSLPTQELWQSMWGQRTGGSQCSSATVGLNISVTPVSSTKSVNVDNSIYLPEVVESMWFST